MNSFQKNNSETHGKVFQEEADTSSDNKKIIYDNDGKECTVYDDNSRDCRVHRGVNGVIPSLCPK